MWEIQDLDDFYGLYSDLFDKNKDIFDINVLQILEETSNKIHISLWLRAGQQQYIDLLKNKQSILDIDKLVAIWKWKQIMFTILKYAIDNDIDILKLKAEPLFSESNTDFIEKQKKLYDFYWYFGFWRIWESKNMQLNLSKISSKDLEIIYNRFNLYIIKQRNILKNNI